ncbi:MAG: sugar ABC transporter permease, partial [Acidobacteria bacterium]|nr:sugar ABC transporter permease [Acidobacteriota bacterium]
MSEPLAHHKLSPFFRYWQIYALMLPALIYVLLFNYAPMYGLQIAFKDFRSSLGIWRSSWVGLKHFATFIKYPGFWHVLWNTFSLSAYQLVAGFPAPII